ncbi:nuclear transport factor 2 family protein [Brevundimonas sp. A19_0]|uniref:nuclear transport factor 2 family protein n=1 Tax=Brevundimonas sp. A19_0 TaxID=2821087 RepID=UPI001ADC66BD|nr:nuclear transport factor 2 family protein [Brevundimonas sp. A19_0]MBO9500846.1 nuclear transport factor 2 family protein [Brevundimonas sp. A19_0]
MKTLLTLAAAAAILAPVPALAQSQSTEAPAAVIDALHQAAREADGATYFSLFTPEARFIGTDATERWTVDEFRAYADPYFSRGQGWDYRVVDRDISILPIPCRCVAVFEEVLDNDNYGTTRGSGVVRLTDDGWKIDQYVLSFAVPNDVARDVVDVIRAGETTQP